MKKTGHSNTKFWPSKLIFLVLLLTSFVANNSLAQPDISTGVQTPFEVIVVREDTGGLDLNGDGDTSDHVLHVFDTLSATTTNVGLAIAGSVQIWENLIAFHVDEAASDNIDLNDDGDSTDQVLHVLDFSTGSTLNLRLAGTFLSDVQISDLLAFGVREISQGLDLNGDGDNEDFVLHVFNAVTGSITNIGFATLDYRITGKGNLIAFHIPESSEGLDLNGDLDISDNILHVFDIASGITTNVQLSANARQIISGQLVGFHVYEGSEGIDLNDDGDILDPVLHVFDTATGVTTNHGRDTNNTPPFSAAIPTTVPPDFKVAFIGDQGLGPDSVAVLQLISDEGASMVLHQGDFEYTDDPDAWDQQINSVLGTDFPYFASIGNHDKEAWPGYQQKLSDRLARIPGAACTGDLGVNSSCTYEGLFFVLSGAGTLGSAHDAFIRDELARDNSIWRVCSWHKNMNMMQIGGKFDSTGWPVYEECRKAGAMIVTGHEHSYERTRTLNSMEFQTIDPDWTMHDEVRVAKDASFVIVSGIAGRGIRNQDRCLPTTFPYGCKGEWASIYSSSQGAQYGALFCTFHVNGQPDKAHCYFKDIDGNIPDEFNVTSFMGGPPEPDMTVTPDSNDYPGVAIGSSVTQTFVVSNDGSLDLNVVSVSLVGTDPGDFSIASGGDPFVLTSGQSHEVIVSFNPTSEGTKSATLRFTSNDIDENPFDVSLSSTGVDTPSGGKVTFQDVQTGGSTSAISVTTSDNVTAVSGDLYLAAVTSKSIKTVTSVTGMGLTWTPVLAQCSGRNQTSVAVWKAQGNPSGSGRVTATLSGPASNTTIAVSRYSGTDQTNPIGNIVSGNTNGVTGSCSGGTDTNTYSFDLNTTVTNSMVYSAVAMRHRIHTPGAVFTERQEFARGISGGVKASVAIMDQTIASPSTVAVDGGFNNNVDYAVIGIEITPASNVALGPIAGNTFAVDVTNSFAFLGVEQQLVIFDVVDPRNRVQVGKVEDLGDSVHDIQVIGNLAFIAAGTAGLYIIDVLNPQQPITISSTDTPGMVNGVYVAGDYVYLAAGGAGLLVMDISDLANPTLVAISETLDFDNEVFVSGGFAYVASGEEGVRVVDVTDPTMPLTIGSIRTPNDANDLFIEGDLVYIAAGSGGLQIVDVSDPSDPQELAVVDTGFARRVLVEAETGFAYVATERRGVWVIDITNPTAPKRIRRFLPEGSANSLDVEGDYIYVADGVGGLLIINTSRNRLRELHREFVPAHPAVVEPLPLPAHR